MVSWNWITNHIQNTLIVLKTLSFDLRRNGWINNNNTTVNSPLMITNLKRGVIDLIRKFGLQIWIKI